MALRIEVTRDSSFCPGVDRAFRIAEKTLFGETGRSYSIGPLIHNPQVVSRLQMLGLTVIDPEQATLPDLDGVPVIIRSHGIDIDTEKQLRELGAILIDATCPTVKLAQEATHELVESGRRVVIVGSSSHPEVKSLIGRAGGKVSVIESAEEAKIWIEKEGHEVRRAGIVCQTTIPRELLDSVTSTIKSLVPDVEVRDTICKSVSRRREEALALAKRVDLMLVVGGRNSSNTTTLASICSSTGIPTYLIEDSTEIQPGWFEGIDSVGITGGASTPDWQIDETVERLKELSAETGACY